MAESPAPDFPPWQVIAPEPLPAARSEHAGKRISSRAVNTQKRTLISRWPELRMQGAALATAEPEQAGVVIAVPGWRLCRENCVVLPGNDGIVGPCRSRPLPGSREARPVVFSGGPGWSRVGWFAAARSMRAGLTGTAGKYSNRRGFRGTGGDAMGR